MMPDEDLRERACCQPKSGSAARVGGTLKHKPSLDLSKANQTLLQLWSNASRLSLLDGEWRSISKATRSHQRSFGIFPSLKFSLSKISRVLNRNGTAMILRLKGSDGLQRVYMMLPTSTGYWTDVIHMWHAHGQRE